MPTSSFNGSTSNSKPPRGTNILGGATLGLAGLDLTTPVDMLKVGKTPFAKNFRLYAKQADSRKVAVSSRKGAGYLMEAVGEVNEYQQVGITGASTTTVGVILGVQGTRFQAISNNHLTRVDIKPSDPLSGVTGTLLVEVWSDNAGLPGAKLATSSIDSGSIGTVSAYLPARFINAVKLTTSSYYWIIVRMQDDGSGAYTLDTTTDYAGYQSNSTLNSLAVQTYGINIKVYSTPEATFKGSHRFLRDDGSNTTMVAYNDGMYYLDSANVLRPLVTGLNINATEYKFANADNKVFWVNGYDDLTYWNGQDELTAANIISNGNFNTDLTGWTAFNTTTIAATTTNSYDGTQSMFLSDPSVVRGATTSVNMLANHRYKISMRIRADGGTNFIRFTGGSDVDFGDVYTPLTWEQKSFYYTPTVNKTSILVFNNTNNFYIDDISIIDTGVYKIIDTELRIASDVIYNKDRLWTKAANDPNYLQWCEAPGNPTAITDPTTGAQTATTASQQWYNSWRSVDYRYVPRPHNGSPVVSTIGFQNAITVFTQDKKYIVDGYDAGSYTMRESTGSKGAVGSKSVAVDENHVFFVAGDGFYRYDGSNDEKISTPISPIFEACPRKADIRPVVWRNQVRFYMASSGSPYNDICMIYDKDLDEWMMDTEVFVKEALWLNDLNDSQDLLESSSLVPQMFYADKQYNNLGAPIDFEYRFTYDSMKTPGQKKRIKRFVPILQGVDTTFPITLGMDKDFQDSPKEKTIVLTTNGAVLDSFTLGDGTILGGDKSFKTQRQSYSGYANYWQFRLMRYAANNRVAFIGAQYTYKTKRL